MEYDKVTLRWIYLSRINRAMKAMETHRNSKVIQEEAAAMIRHYEEKLQALEDTPDE